MGYIRFAVAGLVAVVVLVLSVVLLAIDWIVGLFSMKARDRLTMKVVYVAFSIILFAAGTRIHVSGAEKLKKDTAYIYIGNHRSFFDVLVAYRIFPSITSFIAKKEFANVPFLSWWMRMLHNLFLDREDIKQGLKTTLTAIDYAKGGMSICVFPEGTRNKTEEPMLPFHAATFKIAEKSGCPIIPMTMYNMSDAFEDHFPQVKRTDVFIDFGEPIYVKDLAPEDKKRLSDYVRDIMLVRYEELKKQYEELNVK